MSIVSKVAKELVTSIRDQPEEWRWRRVSNKLIRDDGCSIEIRYKRVREVIIRDGDGEIIIFNRFWELCVEIAVREWLSINGIKLT